MLSGGATLDFALLKRDRIAVIFDVDDQLFAFVFVIISKRLLDLPFLTPDP